jgi:hypothetical protein
VISVDTSVAHLAGTLGKETWLLLPFSPDWRWLQDSNETPWYPGMRLYRQRSVGRWQEVLDQIAVDLQHRLSGAAFSRDMSPSSASGHVPHQAMHRMTPCTT